MQISKFKATTSPLIYIYGAEGRGKTTLASKFHSPLFIPLERGIPSGLSVDAVEGVDSFEGYLAAMREIYSDAREYKTLVVDGTEMLEGHVVEYLCAKHNWKNIESPPFGKGWVAADDEWRRIIRSATAVRDKHGMTIVFIGHSDIVRVDDPRAPSYTSYAPRLHKRARALLMDAMDAVFFLAEDLRVITENSGFNDRTRASAATGRFLFTEGRPAFTAKNRFGMPEKIPLPIDFNFSELAQYWA
jgi:AAA domain